MFAECPGWGPTPHPPMAMGEVAPFENRNTTHRLCSACARILEAETDQMIQEVAPSGRGDDMTDTPKQDEEKPQMRVHKPLEQGPCRPDCAICAEAIARATKAPA